MQSMDPVAPPGRPRQFALRILKASWGIAIDLDARSVLLPSAPAELVPAGDRVWLDSSRICFPAADIGHLQLGLSIAAPSIERRVASGHVVVEVLAVSYTPTDYQSEGLTAAMLGWAGEEFNFLPPTPEVKFDAPTNRYGFRWQDDPATPAPGT